MKKKFTLHTHPIGKAEHQRKEIDALKKRGIKVVFPPRLPSVSPPLCDPVPLGEIPHWIEDLLSIGRTDDEKETHLS